MGIPTLMFRSSSFLAWEFCQLQQYFTYTLGYQSPTNSKALLGTTVHKVAECIASCKLRLQENPKANMQITDSELGIIKFTKKQLYSDNFITKLLDMAYEYYTTNDKHNEYNYDKDYKFCKDMVDSYLLYKDNDRTFDPRYMNIVAPEKKFKLDIDEPWAEFEYEGEMRRLYVQGTMDLIVESQPNTLEYIDLKTGARKNWATGEIKTYEKLQDDFQLLLYYYAISKLYPQYDYIIMTIFFLRDGGPFSLCFDKSDHKKLLDRIRDRFFEIKNTTLPKPINKWRSDFRCQRLCHFYKTNWPGTNTRMCNYVEDHIKTYGIEVTSKELKEKDFTVGFYSPPGAI